MSNQKNAVIAVIVIVVLIAAVIIYWSLNKTSDQDTLQQEQQAILDIQENLETATQIDLPLVNPLDQAVPDVNPIEKTNPFKVANPFQ